MDLRLALLLAKLTRLLGLGFHLQVTLFQLGTLSTDGRCVISLAVAARQDIENFALRIAHRSANVLLANLHRLTVVRT